MRFFALALFSALATAAVLGERDAKISPDLCVGGCYVGTRYYCECPDVKVREAFQPDLCVNGCYVGTKYYCECPDVKARDALQPDMCANGCFVGNKYYCQCPN